MSDKRNVVVYENEMEAIRDSRDRDMPLFGYVPLEGKPLWIVAASEHQANLALVERIFPLGKYTKRERDDRYVELLEQAVAPVVETQE